MKTSILPSPLRILVAALLTIGSAVPALQASDIDIRSGSYSFSGASQYFSSGTAQSGYYTNLGSGYYQNGSMTSVVKNNSSNRSGTVCLVMWRNDYIGATSGTAMMSRKWGGYSDGTFLGYQTWTCTKAGYRKVVNKYGYASFQALEYVGGGSWAGRDELFFSTYSRW